MPKDGGIRVGYQCGDRVFLFGGPPQGYSARQLARQREEQERMASGIVYVLLPRSRHGDGECIKCGTYPNEPMETMTTSGMRPVITCTKCGTRMRPKLW